MDVFGEDADEYVCRAVNRAGVKSTRAELLIMSELSFSIGICDTHLLKINKISIKKDLDNTYTQYG